MSDNFEIINDNDDAPLNYTAHARYDVRFAGKWMPNKSLTLNAYLQYVRRIV